MIMEAKKRITFKAQHASEVEITGEGELRISQYDASNGEHDVVLLSPDQAQALAYFIVANAGLMRATWALFKE